MKKLVWALVLALSCGSALAAAPTYDLDWLKTLPADQRQSLRPGGTVEYRFTVDWDPVTVVKFDFANHPGEVLIRHSKLRRADEWISLDELRPRGGWNLEGIDKVEYEFAGQWHPALVRDRRAGELMVDDGGLRGSRWIQLKDIRPYGGWGEPDANNADFNIGGVDNVDDVDDSDNGAGAPPVIAAADLQRVERSGEEAIAADQTPTGMPKFAAPARLRLMHGEKPFPPAQHADFRRADSVITAADDRHASMLVVWRAMQRDQVHVQVLDLLSGEPRTPIMRFPEARKPIAVAPDGTLVLTLAGDAFDGGNKRASIVDVSGAQPAEVAVFQPFGDGPADHIAAARFIDAQRVLVEKFGGSVSEFRLEDAKVSAAWSTTEGSVRDVDPTGRLVLLATRKGPLVVDTQTRKVAARLAPRPSTALAFSPDLQQIAGFDGTTMTLWNVDEPEPAMSVALPETLTRLDLTWIDGQTLLATSRESALQFDVQSGLPVMTFTTGGGTLSAVNDTMFARPDSPRGDQLLRAFELPTPAARKRTAEVRNLPDSTYAVLPGTKVALDLRGVTGDAASKADFEKSITQALADAGYKLDPAAAIKLVVTSTAGDARDQEYQDLQTRQTTNVRIVPLKHRAVLMRGATELWATGTTWDTFGGIETLKEGETLQGNIEKQRQASIRQLSGLTLPGKVLDPEKFEVPSVTLE